ncbi:MAG TPA: hypothetical protein VHB79_02545 [Polyangiaceae bacterium]|nr:hypothetical protein [Polyangiaceae bacterium]
MRYSVLLAAATLVACQGATKRGSEQRAAPLVAAKVLLPAGAAPAPVTAGNPYGPPGAVSNHFAYIPPQCYAKVEASAGKRARNPCYTCHTDSVPPNYVGDGELQLTRSLPSGARENPWSNLSAPAPGRVPNPTDDELRRFVRTSNYLIDGRIALAEALRSLPAAWDGQGDGKWDGFVPDVWYRLDEQGFDHAPDGAANGWRAFTAYPLPGAFMPTNGSAGDVLIRLAPAFRQNAAGAPDAAVYVANLAIVEALITRADVPIDALDEQPLGVDLDQDGRLAVARRVVFRVGSHGTTPMHYVGRAHVLEASGELPIAPGLFPVGTEFFHTVRYLDVTDTGQVVPAAHLKELRYAKKMRWYAGADLKAIIEGEAREQSKTEDGSHPVLWSFDHGIDNGQGWYLQGFIEAADGALRPQTFEETAYCAGCHGGVGRTTDSIFSFARKLGSGAANRGWFHFSQRGLSGVPEPRSRTGVYEYSQYLQQAQGGDDYAENDEVQRRFFDERGAVRPAALAQLHADVTQLLLPSPERALALDRAYLATTREQSFVRGRDTVASAVHNLVGVALPNERTGVRVPVSYR